MKFGINTLDDFELEGKTVLVRVDMNQPVDKTTETLNSTHRIEACAPTIAEIADADAKVVVMCHQGSDIEYKNFYNTRPHAKVLAQLIDRQVQWIDDVCGPAARAKIKDLHNGQVLLLDNVRFQAEEMTLFEKSLKLTHKQQADTQVVRELAPLANLYVNDAFAASHRDQPTLCGFEQLLPSAMGRLFEREYVVISKLMNDPVRPCIFVLGGAKIADAFIMLDTVLGKGAADKVLTGGLVGQITLLAKGENIGSESVEFIKNAGYEEYIDVGKKLIHKYGEKIDVPSDIAFLQDGFRAEAEVGKIPSNAEGLDIGSKTIERYKDTIANAKTVFVNGPMGVFEKPETEAGTKAIFEALGDTNAHTVVGGGDSVTAAKKYKVTDKLGYVCTGGGALIRFLTGEELPVVAALRFATKKFGCDK